MSSPLVSSTATKAPPGCKFTNGCATGPTLDWSRLPLQNAKIRGGVPKPSTRATSPSSVCPMPPRARQWTPLLILPSE